MIIAEIGQNHCGDMQLAKYLIAQAKENGADLVKFQLYDSQALYGEYQESELSKEQATELFNYGRDIGIEVFFSVFDTERVKWCEEMGVRRYKVACGRGRDKRLMRAIRRTDKLVYISFRSGFGLESPTRAKFLFCIPDYPTDLYQCQFNALDFSLIDGFSDHTIGLDVAKIALARGAGIIEKHFAIDHKTGIDAEWSMTPEELKELKRWSLLCQEVL